MAKHTQHKTLLTDPTEAALLYDRRYQNGMRLELDKRLGLTARYIHRLKTQEFRMQDAARLAESKRIDEQLHLRDMHDREKSDMMAKWADTTATAFSAALSAGLKTGNERLDRLEKFMYEQSGKSTGIGASWGILVAVGGLLIGAGGIVAAIVIR